MKLNKKILCATLAGAMSLTSVSAFAASIPAAKDNAQRFMYAEMFYDRGLYYEAREVLQDVVNSESNYDVVKAQAWLAKVNANIQDWEFKSLVSEIYDDVAKGDLACARADYAKLAAMDLTFEQSQKRDVVAALVAKPVTSAAYAEKLETVTYGPLAAPDLYYSTVKVARGY